MFAIGMDIGGTNTVFGIVDKAGKVLAEDSVKTRDFPVLDDYIQAVSVRIRQLCEKQGIKMSDIAGLGIGAPNANYYKGTIEFAPNLPWKDAVIPLADLFSAALGGMKVKATNDANAAALGEKTYGVAKGLNNFIMITLGTGVGSGIVVNGELVYGHDGFAGELGHVIVKPNGRLCGCGRKGCLETYCSATGIVRTAREFLQTSDETSLLRNIPLDGITSKDIYDAAVKGDAMAVQIFKETGAILGQAFANFVAFSSPEAIILFGGLAKAGDFIRQYTYEAMEANLLNIYKGKTRLLVSSIKDSDAAVLGASAIAW